MRLRLFLGLLILIVQQSIAPPVTQEKKTEDENKKDDLEYMEYHRYLKEVVQVLESDPKFRSKLENADESDIRNGKIANELEFASHHVRSKLDELKRQELERLRYLYTKEYELQNGLDTDHLKIAEHVDRENPHTFEINDLKKLIIKTTKDLDEADKQRREKFKEYEMEKKFEQEVKMSGNTELNEEDRKKYEEELLAMQKKHKKHEPLHHPGSKQQFEEVWEKQDHMESQDFNPRTFFLLHDLDGNGAWDQNEVKALFRKELDKLYTQGAPESDLLERAEEMERMREHVFKEADHNRDGLISYQEFLDETKKPEFQKDPGWEGLDEQQIFTLQEYEEFEKRRHAEEVQKMIAKGIQPTYQDVSGQQLFSPQYGVHPDAHGMQHPNYVPQMGNQAPNQMPQQYHAQPPVPPQHYQQYQGQVPPQHYQGQGMPQYQQGQVPPQHYQGQVPPQHQVPEQQHQIPQQQHQIPQQQQHQIPQQQNQIPQQQHQIPQQQHQIPQQQQHQIPQKHQIPQQQHQIPQQQQQHQIPQQRQIPQQQQHRGQQNVPSQIHQQNSQQAPVESHKANSIPVASKA